ncbi:MAG: leucine-rich repeat domain-containing protein [Candidatus Thorarchaeota archaeon]|jgi:hypothetical protein
MNLEVRARCWDKKGRAKIISSDSEGRILDLSRRGLVRVDLSEARGPALEEINLSGNRMESIDLLGIAAPLRTLDLSKNNLLNLDLGPIVLSAADTLEYMDLSKNKLETIDLEPMYFCAKMKKVIIKKNKLRRINLGPFSECSKLEHLDISGNPFAGQSDFPRELGIWTVLRTGYNDPIMDITPLVLCRSLKEVHLPRFLLPFLVWSKYRNIDFPAELEKLVRSERILFPERSDYEGVLASSQNRSSVEQRKNYLENYLIKRNDIQIDKERIIIATEDSERRIISFSDEILTLAQDIHRKVERIESKDQRILNGIIALMDYAGESEQRQRKMTEILVNLRAPKTLKQSIALTLMEKVVDAAETESNKSPTFTRAVYILQRTVNIWGYQKLKEACNKISEDAANEGIAIALWKFVKTTIAVLNIEM